MSVVPVEAVRPVPWPRMGWVAWRRYRATLAAVIGVLVAIATYLVIDGLRMRSVYSAYLNCRPTDSAKCQFAWDSLREAYGQTGLVTIVLVLLPGLVGAFVGAPVLAREMETGTFRYTWTQGAGRMRWAVSQLVAGALGVAVVTGAFGILVAWHNQPLTDVGITARLHSTAFSTTGLAMVGWALIGDALGVFAGLVWRRVLPALATAFAAWFGLAVLTATSLRPNYLSPLTTTSLELPVRDLPLSTWWTKGGVRVGESEINAVLDSVGARAAGGEVTVPTPRSSGVDPVQYLLQHGYQQVTSYQPDGRFWTFQWIEFGWLTAVAVLLLAASLWLLRRRPS